MTEDRSRSIGENWFDTGYILEPELTEFADRLEMHNEKKRKIRDHSEVFDISHMWKGDTVQQDGKKGREGD